MMAEPGPCYVGCGRAGSDAVAKPPASAPAASTSPSGSGFFAATASQSGAGLSSSSATVSATSWQPRPNEASTYTHTHSRPRSLPLHLSLPLFLPPSLPTTHPTPPHPQPPTLLLSCVAAACDGQDGSAGDSASGEALAKRCRHGPVLATSSDAGTSQANSSYLECSIAFPICAFRAKGLPKRLGFGQDGWSSFGSGAASSVTVSSAHQRFPECTSKKPSSLSEGSASVCAGDVSLELLHQIHAQMAEMDWENAERDQEGAAEWLEMERIWNSICST